MSRYHRGANVEVDTDVPEEVETFLRDLDEAVLQKDMAAAHTLYETVYPQLTQQFFTTKPQRGVVIPFRPWPHLKFVKHCFNHPTTELLYMMLYNRHLFTDRTVSPNTRIRSWENYMEIFSKLMAKDVAVDLPNGWLWDICDELVFQLQTHHNRRLKEHAMKDFPQGAWTIAAVTDKLNEIVEASNTFALLKKVENGEIKATEYFNVTGADHIHRTLGLFSLITLMRLDVTVGDYNGALAKVAPLLIPTTGRQLVQSIAPAHVSLFYSLGFSCMMLRRYTDAVAILKHALSVKAVNRTYVDALQSQVVSLVTLSSTLGCLPSEDFSAFVSERSRQYLEDDAQLLGQGDLDRFRDVFLKSCPKFVSLSPSGPEFTGHEGKELQLRVFMRAVQQQVNALKLRGYLRVYSTIDAAKVGVLVGSSQKDHGNHAHLVCLKQKSIETVHTAESGNDLLSGVPKSTATIDFAVNGNHVSVIHRKNNVSVSHRFIQLLEQVK